MTPQDASRFTRLVSDVSAFYRQDFSDFAGRVWWQAMQPFDFEAVAEAFNRHCVNPDSGQFMPKPADIIRMLQGSTQDSALVAWAKVDRGLRTVGTYRSVSFDDPLIHRVLTEMGGWIELGRKNEDEWPFVRNEFVNRYRGYKMRSEIPDFPPHLVGMAEAQNAKTGFAVEAPLLLGDPAKAAQVRASGSDVPLLQITTVVQLAANQVPRLGDGRKQA
ncbi:DUF6475 domain-containing protein [Cupriavidus numazuensis]|uniref:DUF6475 domain-containing protein n=1 Tax=Cupriavidus numazuensis TaxID=221992 RepID=A0ABN7PV59_9BURK|nr:DUF6475 domain-containing protein [Cupriavidus numazuensis]CAG2132345.1 hypothetical protein LMG26411_00601 [Cupriavidus numazuensis]